MYPITLGANIGTTVTGLLAALLSTTDAMQVALAHLFFNITGIVIFYPIPIMRAIPMHAARQLGKATRIWRGFPFAYILVMFFLVPLIFLGLSWLFTEDSIGLTVLGSMFTIAIAALVLWFVYWWRFNDGKNHCHVCLVNRQRRAEASRALPDDMEYLKAQIQALTEHTGLSPEEEDKEDAKEDEKEALTDAEQPETEDVAEETA
jgi:solute carrier family 34 (sodium-dependent phosphate cotransporter)